MTPTPQQSMFNIQLEMKSVRVSQEEIVETHSMGVQAIEFLAPLV